MTCARMTKRLLQWTTVALVAGCAAPPVQHAGLDRIQHIVVIYAENRSFDNLYGMFPGANGVANATPAQYTQVDRDGNALATLPPVWKGKDPDPAFPLRVGATATVTVSLETDSTPTVSRR